MEVLAELFSVGEDLDEGQVLQYSVLEQCTWASANTP